MTEKEQTHFGYETIDSEEKEGRVGAVFDLVAGKYDLMNDVMSAGIHRAWKNWYVWQTGVKPGEAVLDLAAGTGDITLRLAKRMRGKEAGADIEGRLVSSDINAAMLKIGEERLTNKGWLANLEFIIANAEALPFADNSFDLITMAFGLRNVTDKEAGLREMHRVLKVGGQARVLEFSEVTADWFKPIYDFHSFKILPKLGQLFARDGDSYQYLAESIRKHPPQEQLKAMMTEAGFERCHYKNLTGGIVSIHSGYKL